MKANSPIRLRIHYLAIRHRPTGGFLPASRGYGFTREEPSLVKPPRLFVRPSSATQALDYWLEGEHYEGSDDPESGALTLKVIPRPHRRREEMEIVEIELIPRTLTEAQLRTL